MNSFSLSQLYIKQKIRKCNLRVITQINNSLRGTIKRCNEIL